MQMTEREHSIEVTNVNLKYNDNSVLEDVSFSVKNGEYLGIIGPNGGGKTTLLKIILGLLKPDTGEVKILGQNIGKFRKRFQIGYVPQRVSQAEFYFPATVEEIVRSGRTARVGLFKRFGKNDKRAIERAVEVADVGQYKNRLVGKLSGGERQKVFIARALAGEPKILILDEPAVGVDIASQEQFYTFLESLNQKEGITIVFVSHEIGVIAHEVHNILCLNSKLFYHGSPKSFIKGEFLERLYGKKVTSIFHGH